LFCLKLFSQNIEQFNFSITVHPSGGIQGFSINVNENKLDIITRSPKIINNKIVLGDSINREIVLLTRRNRKRLNSILTEVKTVPSVKRSEYFVMLDVWLVDFLFEPNKIIQVNSSFIGGREKYLPLKKLLKYLQKISKTDISLRGLV